ncbi:YegP family protein [Paenarthrobacter sp. TAF1]|uniref:YegP family protein n=1 Tax=Paenarthrobacter sp. TAF1 TaxID=3233067 RepID=UPI003F962B0A
MTHGSKIRSVQRQARRFLFRLKAGNGELIASSESYTKAAALNGIDSVKNNAGSNVADLTGP